MREELHPQGLEVVSVALDTGGVDAAGPWIDRARTTHPALIDAAHVLDELLGIVNVPTGIWVDESGRLVRPPEPAFPWRPRQPSDEVVAQLPPLLAEQLRESQKIRIDPEPYLAPLRDWVTLGESSRYALSPDQVIARSRPRAPEHSEAAACFELAQHLHRGARVLVAREKMGSAGGQARQARLPTRGTRQHAPITGSALAALGTNAALENQRLVAQPCAKRRWHNHLDENRRRSGSDNRAGGVVRAGRLRRQREATAGADACLSPAPAAS